MTWFEAAARWYVLLVAVTWAFAPLLHWLCAKVGDRGATIARPVALLAAIYPAWVLSSLGAVRFDEVLLAVTVLAGSLLSWVIAIRRASIDLVWLRTMAAVEIASLCLFATYIALRGFTPEIMGTEKPMDVAFLASSARATQMPPPDPWFAGEPINYYYLGYLVHGSLARVAGVPPQLGFNLALATIFSATVVAAFGVAWNMVRGVTGRLLALSAGVLAAFGVAIAGNLYAPLRLLQDASATVDASWWDSTVGIGWRSSRIVCDGPRVGNLCPFPATETINEFPVFSFLLGDLHPHLMALPFTLVAITLAWDLAGHIREGDAGATRAWYARVALSGVVIGALVPLNTWDFPTFIALALFAVWIGCMQTRSRAAGSLLLLLSTALLAWLPFVASYAPPTFRSIEGPVAAMPIVSRLAPTIGIHTGEHTSAVEYLTIFGVPYVIGLIFVVSAWLQRASGDRDRVLRRLGVAVPAVVVSGVLLAAPVLPLCGIPLVLAVDELWRDRLASAKTFALMMLALAWILSTAVELVYLRDAFDDRMNTLFKVYYQTWTLYAIAAAIATALLWSAARRLGAARAILAVGVGVWVIASAAYPVVASYQWTSRFASWQGLDGLAFGAHSSPYDVEAIRWLQRHAAPGDIVLEAAGCSYLPFDRLPFNRVSAFTGVPTVIGWGDNHQRQWRAGQPALIEQIGERQEDVAAMYADPRSPLFDRYNVDWLFVGDYESGNWQSECATAGPYAGVSDQDFPGPGWEEAFRSGSTTIYRRDPW